MAIEEIELQRMQNMVATRLKANLKRGMPRPAALKEALAYSRRNKNVYKDLNDIGDELELSLTPKAIDLKDKPKIIKQINTHSKFESDGDLIVVTIVKSDDGTDQARYKVQVGQANPPSIVLGLLEAVVTARFATESLIDVNHTLSYSVPAGLDLLLSKYGLANVQFIGDTQGVTNLKHPYGDTLLLSGGADSTHLLFKYLKGKCNAVTLFHGQPSFHIGAWTEKQAAETAVQTARETFNESIPHSILRSNWKGYQPREWAKAYRNFLSVIQAYMVYPGTNIWLGTSLHDELHDCHPDFIKAFSQITGIQIKTPNVNVGRREIMKDLVDLSLNGKHPYLYASTASCQVTRYLGKKHLYCGSCHSCLLRLPGAEFGADPRFSNFNKDLKLIPKGLEDKFTPDNYYKRHPSINIMRSFFGDFQSEITFRDFVPSLRMMQKEWNIPMDKFLIEMQLALMEESDPNSVTAALTEAVIDAGKATPGRPNAPSGLRDRNPPSFADCVQRIAKRKMRGGMARALAFIQANQDCTGARKSLTLQKAKLTKEKLKELGGNPILNASRIGKEIQTFKGERGFWITIRAGRKVFVSLDKLQGATLSKRAKAEKAKLLQAEGRMRRKKEESELRHNRRRLGVIILTAAALFGLNKLARRTIARTVVARRRRTAFDAKLKRQSILRGVTGLKPKTSDPFDANPLKGSLSQRRAAGLARVVRGES